MYGETLYDIWAPGYSVWAPWIKPVLFAHIKSPPLGAADDEEWRTMDITWAPPAAQRTAIILDLPGATPIRLALRLAQEGYFPVVLHNGCPGLRAAIELQECFTALCSGEQLLRELVFAPDAPPAFLLDSRRTRGDRRPLAGDFDNRWVVLPQDFPSASFMLSHRIQQVAVIQMEQQQPAEDLRHILLRWQEAGIKILVGQLGLAPKPMQIARPSRFRAAWYALLANIGLRHNSAGGFGSVIPLPSQSSGFG
jgi:hypothetical protein